MKTRSQREEERREKRNKIVISLILVFLMVFSTIGFFFSGSDGTTIRYNGHKIRAVLSEQGFIQGYVTEVDDRQIYFLTTPEDTLSVPLPTGFADSLRNAEAIVFLFDPAGNNTEFYDQLRFDFSTAIPKPQAAALTQPSANYPFQVASCADTQPAYPLVLLRSGQRNITYEGGCYVLQGEEPYDFALLRDRIVYAYHGITEE